MPFTFDATLKDLAREYPRDFVTTFAAPTSQPLSLLNVDLSTVTASADLAVGIGDPLEEIFHLDFQSTAKSDKHLDILVYNTLLHRHHKVPVHSLVVLLRRQAAHSNLSGAISYATRGERGKIDFRYEVVRLWEYSAEDLLSGKIGITPLAPLGKLPTEVSMQEGLADIIQRLVDRLVKEAAPDRSKHLLTSAFLLTGLRVSVETAKELFRGASAMQESSTYVAIVDEGREKQNKRIILRLGEKRLGSPDESARAKLAAISDIDRLEEITDKIFEVSSWQELFS